MYKRLGSLGVYVWIRNGPKIKKFRVFLWRFGNQDWSVLFISKTTWQSVSLFTSRVLAFSELLIGTTIQLALATLTEIAMAKPVSSSRDFERVNYVTFLKQDQIHHANTMQLKVRKIKKCDIEHGLTMTSNVWKLKSSWHARFLPSEALRLRLKLSKKIKRCLLCQYHGLNHSCQLG